MISAVSPSTWVLTLLFLAAVVVLDLRVIARRTGEVTLASAARWVLFYVALALAFGVVLLVGLGGDLGTQFFAGYITEYSLSVDNLFVFVIIMHKFAVPGPARDKVLYIGILLSMALRGVFILAGAAFISAASWSFYLFGALLLYTAYTLLVDDDEDADFQEYGIVRGLRKVLPMTDGYAGDAIVVRDAAGKRRWTPLVIAIASIGVANVVFALDSIPAIFGLTQDAFVVITANAFALMGLRQLYFLVGGLLERLIYLNIGLSAILAFIGVKLVIEALHGSGVDAIGSWVLPEIGIVTSLGFIVAVLAAATVASLAKGRLDDRVTEAS
ncbi:TerC family protein [Nocardioides ginsengisegetis]